MTTAIKPGRRGACRRVDIGQKVAFLSSPAAYADRPPRVERIETHFSWVFLTGNDVYKLKKPLRDGGVDLSTLAARHRNAELEVRLNRRLARAVYIGILPLTLDRGELAIGGSGAVVDWLVKMRRLPADRMLDARLRRGDWHRGEIEALGACLARFFAAARPVMIEPAAYLHWFRSECRSTRRAFAEAGQPEMLHAAANAARCLEAFMYRRRVVALRAEQRRIVEGHGDLRPEHILLGPTPLIIDCLEFRPDLRRLDPVGEIAFLAMECERLGAPLIGPTLFRRYRQRTGDDPPPVLIAFYKAVSALIRARIAVLHLQEEPVRDPQKWPKRAAEYLAIAGRETRCLDR